MVVEEKGLARVELAPDPLKDDQVAAVELA